MQRESKIALAQGIGTMLANLYHGAQAQRAYGDWRKEYVEPQEQQMREVFPKPGQPQQANAMQGPAALPARGVDETALADLVARIGDNPLGGRYLESANMLYKRGTRERQEQQQAEDQARADADAKRQEQAAMNQAIMAMLQGQGQRPIMGRIPDIAQALQGKRELEIGTPAPTDAQRAFTRPTGSMPAYGPETAPQPGMFEAMPQQPQKVDVGASYIDLGNGQIGQIGYDDYGNQSIIPLPAGARPYQPPKTGGAGADPALTWAMNQTLGTLHSDRASGGRELSELGEEYKSIQKMPSQQEINAAVAQARRTGEDAAAEKINAKYGEVIAPDDKGNWRLLPGVQTRDAALADWRKRQRAAKDKYGTATEKLKGAAATGRNDPTGRTKMKY